MPSQPLTTTEDLLRQLPLCTTAIEYLLDAQPVFATVMGAQLRLALASLVPDSPPDPDAVFLNEYVYDTPAPGAQRVPRITRTRSLTQVLQEAIATQRVPTTFAKEPHTGSVDQAVGFYPHAHDAGRDGEIAALEVAAVNTLVSDLQHDSHGLYSQQLDAFWSSPHASTGALSVLEAISQKQRVMFVLDADLKLNEARQQLAQAEHAQDPTAVATAKARLKVLVEGRQLVENLLLHETSGTATPPLAVAIHLHADDASGWSVPLNGCFVLTEHLHGPRPTALYTPQRGLEVFEHFAAMENALRRRLVSGDEKNQLLANIVVSERLQASSVLSSGQNLRYSPITGPVFRTCLQAQRDQQEADIDQAFSTPHATFEALTTQLCTLLALPLKGVDRVPDPMPLGPIAHTPPDIDHQVQLIQLWNSLNQQLEDVLDPHKHPSLNSVLTSLLKETFPQLPAETVPADLYVNRYRTDSAGQRYVESSRTLLAALCALLRWEDNALQDDQDVPQDHAEGVFDSPTAVSETEQIAQNGTLLALAETLQAQLAAHVTTYWQTPIAPKISPALACPQARLIEVHRQALGVQARLRVADNTLSPHAKLLIDRVLQAPTLARREAYFSHGARPGVYQLMVNTTSAQGARLAGSFVLSPSDGSSPVFAHWPFGHKNLSTQSAVASPVVAYTPDQGFEEFATLQGLHDTLTARINAGEDMGRLLVSGLPLSVQHSKTGLWGNDLRTTFAPIEGDFVADSIQALLDKQQSDIQTLLGLTYGEPDTDSNGRGELAELLDMAGAFMTRNRLLLEHWRPDWEKRLSPTAQQALQDQAQATRERQDELGKQWETLVPTLADYAKAQVLVHIRAYLAEKDAGGQVRAQYPAQGIDPDQTMVMRTTRTRISAGAGFGSLHESVTSTRMSLTNLLLKNNKPWERSLSWSEDDLLQATLMTPSGEWVRDAQGQAITVGKERLQQWVNTLNVGYRYTEDVLKKHLAPDATDAQTLKNAWMASQAAALDYAALTARLSSDAYSTPLASDNLQKKAAAWMAALLASAEPRTRQPVDGQAVVANALMFNPASDAPDGRGGQTVNGVLLLSTAVDEMTVLHTPHAPDGLDLREIASEATLIKLMRSPTWRAYLLARLPANTRLLNPRLVAYPGDFLAGMYRQNYRYWLDKTDTESVTNEELKSQSTFNKVMFGVEVVSTALSGFPWGARLASSAFGWVGRMSRTSVHTLRQLGQNVAGLIMRRGVAGRVLFEVATANATLAGAARTAGIGIKPMQLLLRPASTTRRSDLTGYQRAFQNESARLVVSGGIPAGASLAEGTGIYRTPGSPSTLLVSSVSEKGEAQVFRIQNSFNLYDPNGLVAPVLTPSGGWTQFRLRKMPNQRWLLDTLERAPGGGPKTDNKITRALKEWHAHVTDHAQSPNPMAALDPTSFFSNHGIPINSWNKYVRQTGTVNAAGRLRINPGHGHVAFTDELFITWAGLGDQTPATATAFVQAHNISPTIWAIYVNKSGKLTHQGLTRSIRLAKFPAGGRSKITDQHILDWDRLYLRPQAPRTTPIRKEDVMRYAFDNNIHLDSWLKYVSPKGGIFLRHNSTHVVRLERLGITTTPPQTTSLDYSLAGPSQPPV
jgi:hypothetical protein